MSDSVDSIDYSPPGPSVHGILQARILDGLRCPPSGDFPDLGIQPVSIYSALTDGSLTTSITWEAGFLVSSDIYSMFKFANFS